MRDDRNWRLLNRACLIQDKKAPGFWLPIAWHLALRGETEAMLMLADWYAWPFATHLGNFADPFDPYQLYRRAYRRGNPNGAYNLAMAFFARRDLAKYRHWLRRAALAGDESAASSFRRFETRRPHANARRIGRLRPWAKRDETA